VGESNKVKRYRETVERKSLTALQDYFAPAMEESEHGKYVLASDYEALQSQLAHLTQQRDGLRLALEQIASGARYSMYDTDDCFNGLRDCRDIARAALTPAQEAQT
jgi:dGTP triphosphohydrolase